MGKQLAPTLYVVEQRLCHHGKRDGRGEMKILNLAKSNGDFRIQALRAAIFGFLPNVLPFPRKFIDFGTKWQFRGKGVCFFIFLLLIFGREIAGRIARKLREAVDPEWHQPFHCSTIKR